MLRNLKYDFPAGISVFLVAVPLCLGIAIASGADPMAGIIAGVIWWIIVWLLSKSPLSVSWPAAGLVAIVSVAITKLGFDQFLIAVVLAGIIQILLGLSKVSKFSHYVPHSVIKGMLAAIGLTLIIKQTPTLLGSVGYDMSTISPIILSIGVLSLIIMVLRQETLGKKYKSIPWSLIAVIAGTIISWTISTYFPELALSAKQLVALPVLESFNQISSLIHIPAMGSRNNPQLYITALTIALVASIETILSIHAIDKLDPEQRKTPLNRELIAQGIGNSLSGLIWWLPITSVIVRSSVNLNSNAKSKQSAIIHGIFLIIAVIFGATLINMIPMACLAAVLIITWYKLISPQVLVQQRKEWYLEFTSFLLTIAVVIAEDLLLGVIAWIIFYYIIRYVLSKQEASALVAVVENEKD